MEKFADIEVLCWNQIEDHVAERILRWIYMGERILCEKGGHMDQGRGILSRIWSTVKFKQMEANIVLNVLSVQY